MKLKRQVTDFELSKRLKELNCPQESLFYYCGGWLNIRLLPVLHYGLPERDSIPEDYVYSAFTVAELGEMLPEPYITNECKLNPDILENNSIDDVKFIAKKLGTEEKNYIYKKLDSKNSDKYVEYLLIKVKKVFESSEKD